MSGDGLGRRNDRSRLRPAWRMVALIVAAGGCAEPDHRDNSILLEQGITIGDTAGPGALPTPPWLLRHSLGYVVTVPNSEMGPVLFDSAGLFVRSLGDLGDGPGEYRRPQGITPLAGDSIIIFDKRVRRGTVMDESLRVARTFPVSTRPWRVIELPDGTLLASSGTYSLQAPFQHLTRDGGTLGPVGEVPKVQGLPVHHMALAPDGTLWTAPVGHRLELTHYDSSLTRVGVHQPDRAWFEPYDANAKRSVDLAPYALVLGIWVDPADRIWVIGATADSQWVEGMGAEQQGEGGTLVRPLRDPALAYDGIIDVYDAATGALLATHREDGLWAEVIEPGLLARYRETEDGWQQATLWTARWRE